MKKNFLKEKLESGLSVIGTWAVVPSAVLTDIIASSGLDFIIIDSEHGPISFETAQTMAIACESRGVSPVMRVAGTVEGDILKALDLGVHCVQIPNITSGEDAARAVRLAKYPPEGNRGFSPFTRAGDYSRAQARELTAAGNSNVLLAIHIEGKEAIHNIDEILKIPELDIVFVGIFDISKSLGIPGDVENPKVITILEDLTRKISRAGKYPGTIANEPQDLQKLLYYGIKYITYSVDCSVVRTSYEKIRADFKEFSGR